MVTVSGNLKTQKTSGRPEEQGRKPPSLYGEPPSRAVQVRATMDGAGIHFVLGM